MSAWRTIGAAAQPLIGAANDALKFAKPAHKPVVFPTGFVPINATARDELDAAVNRLHAKELEWAALPPPARAALLRSTLARTVQVAREAAVAATEAKGSWGTGIGEEWNAWLPVAWGLREYVDALAADGQPRLAGVAARPDGQLVVDAFPQGVESIFFGGLRGEIWIEPGQPASQGALYRAKAKGAGGRGGGVALVLGAGNQTAVVCLDILHKLVVDDAVVVCKMNPVNEYLGPFLKRAFAPLVEAGFLEVVHGGVAEGKHLAHHPLVASVHLTGAAATYDSLVWGANKAKVGAPELRKAVGAELGCVTPYIITPGTWSVGDLAYYADEVVAGLVHNAGHNCTKVEVLVTDAAWPQREAFLAALRARLGREPRRVAWYPGSARRAAAFREAAGNDVEELGAPVPNGAAAPEAYLPWLFKAGVAPDQAVTTTENWCGVLQEVALPGTRGDPAAFLAAAVHFANERCWGSLSCAIIIPPDVKKSYPAAVDAAIAGLRYGSINVNVATMLGFCVTKLPWGAFPGNPPQDIGSGNCYVHNTLLLDHPQKAVLWCPWRFHPTHLWSPSNRNLEAIVPAAINFLAYPSLPRLLAPAVAALRG